MDLPPPLKDACERLRRVVPARDAAVMMDAATADHLGLSDVVAVARLLAVHRGGLSSLEAATARDTLERGREAGINPSASLARLRRKPRRTQQELTLVPQPVRATTATPTPRRIDPVTWRGPVAAVALDVGETKTRLQFDYGCPDFDRIKDVAKMHGGAWNQRKKSPSYWSVPNNELQAIAAKLANLQVDMSGVESALVIIAGRAHEAAAAIRRVRDATLVVPEKITLYDHQDVGVRFLMSRPNCLLADDMGLGKTLQALLALYNQLGDGERVLVLCPKTLMHNWVAEDRKWSTAPTSAIAKSGKPLPDSRIVVISQDTAKREGPLRDALLKVRWALLLIDEAHNFCKTTSQRWKFAHKVKTDRVWLMTATPMMNRPMDLFSLLKLTKHPLGADRFKFGIRYCAGRHDGYGWNFSGSSNIPELSKRLSGWVLRRLKSEVLDLPPKIRGSLMVKVPTRLANMEYSTIDALMRGRKLIAMAKVDATIGRMKEALDADEKVVIFSNFLDVLDALEAACAKDGVRCVRIDGSVSADERRRVVEQFQTDPDTCVFIGQIIAAGVGITLTAATQVIMADLALVPAFHAQAEDRAYRIGTTDRIVVTYIRAEAIVDDAMWEMLESKIDVIEMFEGGLGDADDAVEAGANALLSAVRRARRS